jgi:hypothetical protein
MMTHSEQARRRRRMHHRIRLVLAQRRADAPAVRATGQEPEPAAGPEQRSGEPTAQH